MAAPRIKKRKPSTEKPSLMPRQGAIPCLVILAIIFLIVSVLVFFGFLHTA